MRRRWALQSQDRTTTAPSSPIEVESQPASPPRSIAEDFEAHLAALASEPAPPCSDFIEDPAAIQPSIAQVFQRQRLLQAYPKNPPNAKHSHGDLPTVADLIVGPTTARATPRRNTFYPPVPQADRALHIAPPPKRYRPEPALQFGGLPVPPPPSLPRSLAGSTATQIIPHSSLKSPPATPRPPPASQTPLAPPRPRTVKFRTVRSSLASRMNICGTLWLQLVYKLGKASHLLQSVEAAKQASDHIMAVIRNNTPGTLERYLRIASLFMDFLGSSAISFLDAFASRHEEMHAASQHHPAPTQLDPATQQATQSSPDVIEQFSPESPDPIAPFSDEEAWMVENAALQRQSSDSSSEASSVSSKEPLQIDLDGPTPLFACTGPWGCWHSLCPPDESGVLRTACGIKLGTAAFTSNAPPQPHCRRSACVALRNGA
ncbi:unnamed protein product [Symbiodinium sp. CCMP2592]|nr:unnamed protein product [Symbiodinium sp. CCMP2592]